MAAQRLKGREHSNQRTSKKWVSALGKRGVKTETEYCQVVRHGKTLEHYVMM
jgi:hypothetical protein